MNRGDLTSEERGKLQSLLPLQKQKTGRPNLDHRQIINGILWVLRTGAPWRDMLERFGMWSTISNRFYPWHKAGTWERLLKELQEKAELNSQEHLHI